MNGFEIQLDLDPKQSSLDLLTAGLNKHSNDKIDKAGFKPIALFVRDEHNRIQGGIYGRLNWNWLSVSLLWVDADHRGKGLGAALLKRLEKEAGKFGCTNSHVDTFSFQAREFYLANGYESFAKLPDYPEGHSRVYLRKAL